MIERFNALSLSHKFIAQHVKSGDLCIDATAGRGNDTAYLAQLVGESGKVIAFDIQQDALNSTKSLLLSRGLFRQCQLVKDSHSNLDLYASKGSVKCITFNFGWLPAGDHSIFTHADTSISAIEKGLEVLTCDGIMSLCIYYGRDCGFAEKDALLEFLPTLNHKDCTVLVHDFVNRPNCPPLFVSILKGV